MDHTHKKKNKMLWYNALPCLPSFHGSPKNQWTSIKTIAPPAATDANKSMCMSVCPQGQIKADRQIRQTVTKIDYNAPPSMGAGSIMIIPTTELRCLECNLVHYDSMIAHQLLLMAFIHI